MADPTTRPERVPLGALHSDTKLKAETEAVLKSVPSAPRQAPSLALRLFPESNDIKVSEKGNRHYIAVLKKAIMDVVRENETVLYTAGT